MNSFLPFLSLIFFLKMINTIYSERFFAIILFPINLELFNFYYLIKTKRLSIYQHEEFFLKKQFNIKDKMKLFVSFKFISDNVIN